MNRRFKLKGTAASTPRPDDLRRRVLLKNFFRQQHSSDVTPGVDESETEQPNDTSEVIGGVELKTATTTAGVLSGTDNPVFRMEFQENTSPNGTVEKSSGPAVEEGGVTMKLRLKRKFSMKKPYSFTKKNKVSKVTKPYILPKSSRSANTNSKLSVSLNKKSKSLLKFFKGQHPVKNELVEKPSSTSEVVKIMVVSSGQEASVQTEDSLAIECENRLLIQENKWLRREVDQLLQSNYYLKSLNNNLHLQIHQSNLTCTSPECIGPDLPQFAGDRVVRLGRSKSIQEPKIANRQGCRRVKSVHVASSTNGNSMRPQRPARVPLRRIDSMGNNTYALRSQSCSPEKSRPSSSQVWPPKYNTRMRLQLNNASAFK